MSAVFDDRDAAPRGQLHYRRQVEREAEKVRDDDSAYSRRLHCRFASIPVDASDGRAGIDQ